MIKIRHGLPVALVACTLIVGPVHATELEAAGMVLKVAGETTPELATRTEIPAHTAIRLGSEGKLTFLHYGKCKLVTVVGGTLELSKRNFTTDGKIESETSGPCPQVYQLKGDAGGWVSRDLPPRFPAESEIIFAGRRADNVVEAAVYGEDRGDEPVFRFQLANRRATEPPAAVLTPDKSYVLKIKLKDQPDWLKYSFVAVTAKERGSVVVLRID